VALAELDYGRCAALDLLARGRRCASYLPLQPISLAKGSCSLDSCGEERDQHGRLCLDHGRHHCAPPDLSPSASVPAWGKKRPHQMNSGLSLHMQKKGPEGGSRGCGQW
jgi:hypothetical protein